MNLIPYENTIRLPIGMDFRKVGHWDLDAATEYTITGLYKISGSNEGLEKFKGERDE